MNQASTSRARLLAFAVGGAVLVYTCAYLLWYSGSALGLYPVLDAREHLELARRIADGTLPHEPFYRAPLFAASLAALLHAGVSFDVLPLAARALNGALHLASAALVWSLALRVWRDARAAALATTLFGLNPVVLYFTGDALDLPLAITLLLAACVAVLASRGSVRSFVWAAFGGIACGCAVLTRPQLLVVLPVLAIAAWRGSGRANVASALAFLVPVMALLFTMGAVNHAVGGEFRVLPWQGAYNLWAANGPEANGRYFAQQSRLAMHGEGVNPARVESERRYRAEQPDAPADPATMSRYWSARTLTALRDDPARWLRLEAAKLWYLLNNFEQYDLTTYHVHKAASPWLRVNPLGWAALLALAAIALAGARPSRDWRVLAACAAAYACAMLLTYVNARFRLPLVPLVAVVAGGCTCVQPTRRVRALVIGALVVAVSAWPLPAELTERTIVQDHLLEARAAAMLGFDDEALRAARTALALAPDDVAARELVCVATFNAWLRGAQRDEDIPLAPCEGAASTSPGARRVLGIGYWRLGRVDEAVALWRALLDDESERDNARAALIASGAAEPFNEARVESRPSKDATVVLLASAMRGDAAATAELERRMGVKETVRQLAHLRRTYRY